MKSNCKVPSNCYYRQQLSCLCLFFRGLIVDGQWNAWTQWSECKASCGSRASLITGASYRSRVCNNPKPENEGLRCQGNALELIPCVPSGKLKVGAYSTYQFPAFIYQAISNVQ